MKYPEMMGVSLFGNPRRGRRRRPGRSRLPARRNLRRRSLFGNADSDYNSLSTKYPSLNGGKTMKRRKKGRKRGRKRRGTRGMGGVTAAVKKSVKTTTSIDVFKGVGAGFVGAIGGRFLASLVGKKIAPAGAAPGTVKTVMNLVTAGTGAIGGALFATMVLKSPKAAEMAAAGNLLIMLDSLAGPPIHRAFGFEMGQLRLPEEVAIAGLDQLRLPEEATIAGQYDEMDQVIEEEDLMGEDDEGGVF